MPTTPPTAARTWPATTSPSGPPSRSAAEAAKAPPAKTPNAAISRLSHEWPKPRTARHACSGRPRCSTDAPMATSPVTRAIDPTTVDVVSLTETDSRSQPAARSAPTATCVRASITASGWWAALGWTRVASSGASESLSGVDER